MIKNTMRLTPVMESTGDDTLDLHAPIFKVEVLPSEEFITLMDANGFTRRGRYSWSTGTGDGWSARNLTNVINNLAPGSFSFSDDVERTPQRRERYSMDSIRRRLPNQIQDLIGRRNRGVGTTRLMANKETQYQELRQAAQWTNRNNPYRHDTDISSLHSLGTVTFTRDRGTIWVRLWADNPTFQDVASDVMLPAGPRARAEFTNFNLLQVKRGEERHGWKGALVTARTVLDVLTAFNNHPIWGSFAPALNPEDYIQMSPEVEVLLEKVDRSILVSYVPGQPSAARVTMGRSFPKSVKRDLSGTFKTMRLGSYRDTEIAVAARLHKAHPENILMHPGLEDVARMSVAKPYTGDDRLRPYQQEAVGLHLATDLGYVQTSSPGMGKTVMQLAAMRARSEKIENYRGLIVAEGNVRQQWVEESAKWFPEATAVAITGGKQVDSLVEALSAEGPVVIVTGYAQFSLVYNILEERKTFNEAVLRARTKEDFADLKRPALSVGSLILDQPWDDICADEALVIVNSASKQNTALWAVRENSKVASVLCGTPIDKGVDDLAKYISWVRNDRSMFYGVKLSEQFNVKKLKDAEALMRALGVIVFRRDISEIADELPTANNPEVIKLTPTAAEKALANAAERELRRCYTELVTALQTQAAQAEGADKARAEETAAALVQARGAWLGGTQLARLAASDPCALLDSQSSGAALLASQGLIQAATREASTKRKRLVDIVTNKVREGKQTLVFTEFSSVAKLLVKDLEASGIKAKPFVGGGGAERDRYRVSFQEGDLDVLVCTSAGKRGVTLNKAATVIHYDLPWTPKDVVQRTGRSLRLGSTNKNVEIIFMILEGTIEDKVASVIVKRSIESLQVLDRTRGSDVGKTETGIALAGLIREAGNTRMSEEVMEFAKLLDGVVKR